MKKPRYWNLVTRVEEEAVRILRENGLDGVVDGHLAARDDPRSRTALEEGPAPPMPSRGLEGAVLDAFEALVAVREFLRAREAVEPAEDAPPEPPPVFATPAERLMTAALRVGMIAERLGVRPYKEA